ncbi:MAG: DNA repair protein RadC [Pseudomonadota bacterium]
MSRFTTRGGDSLSDAELLELILFRTLPKCHVGPIADRLLDTFGDLAQVFGAEMHRLEDVKGIGPAVAADLQLIATTCGRIAKARVQRGPILSDWSALLDYCRSTMAHRETEQVRILYLNAKNELIADEVQSEGTVDHAPAYPREIVKRALHHSATALILVHNHPSGDPTPSGGDIAMTQDVVDAAATLNITIHDHLIIGKNGHLSFKAEGYL